MEKKLKKVLFVCSGNTCRSPMAEAWMRYLCKENTGIIPESAGLAACSGSPASIWAREVIRDAGGDLMEHRSQPFTVELAQEADIIAVMTHGHLARIKAALPDMASKTFLLNHWSALQPDSDVPDPFGGGKTEYEKCFAVIREAVQNLYLSLK